MNTTNTFEQMGKEELRAACKAAAVKGWGKMNNTQMRAALNPVPFTPAPEPTPEPSVAATQAAMIAKEDAVVETAVVAPQPKSGERKVQKERATQNGVTRPSDGTICADIWNALETLAQFDSAGGIGHVPTSKDVIELRNKNGWQKNTASTQFQRFKQHYGLMPRSTAGKDE